MMKTLLRKSLTALASLALLNTGYAFSTDEIRTLWTTMQSGGANNLGVIYSVNPDGTNGSAVITFNGNNGANPSGNMVQGPDHWLYGTTIAGGNNNCGVLYKFDPNDEGGQIIVLHNFSAADGRSPRNLLLAGNGKIYGTTQSGGANVSTTAPDGAGTMYEFDPSAPNSFIKLHDFDNQTGEVPQALIQGADGKIYGMCRQGGTANAGVIFNYQPGTGFAKMYDFAITDGQLPTNCKLLQATDGKLYGLTTWGGNNDKGVLFSFNMQGGIFTKLHDFNGLNGAYPTGVLTQAGSGLLYGVTSYGGAYGLGTLFSFNTNTGIYEELHSFNGAQGAVPVGGVIQGSDGMLYGNTSSGGLNGTGVIFNYNITDNLFTVVEDCDGESTGGRPMSNLLELQPLSTGIKNIDAAALRMYPNPANNLVYVGERNTLPGQITVSNLSGQQVLQVHSTNIIDVSALAAGTYLVVTTTPAGQAHARLIKQ